MDKPPFSVALLSQRWDCSEQHIYNLIRADKMASFRIGALIRIAAAEVERIECGSNCTEENGTPSGQKPDEPAASRFVPRIVALPNGA